MDPKTIGATIRNLREAQGMTQSALARACGVAPSIINRIETGATLRFPIGFPLKLSRALKCDVADIWADCEPEDAD